MASYNTSLINTSNTGLLTPQQANEKSKGLLTNTRNEAYTRGVKTSLYKEPTYNKEALSEYTDSVMSRRFSQDFTTALSKQSQKYNEIAEYYKNFYVNGIAYDKNGNPIAGADATSYADRYQFAEFLHELYPELSVEYFMKNADSFMYRATGVKTDVKNYGDHLGNIWNASWQNAGDSIWTAMKYLGGALSGGFGSVEWQNTKKELAKRRSLSGANYRKDLGDEKYNNIFAKMLSGTIEQSPQMAMMLMSMAVSLATGGLSGAGGIVGKLALNSMARAKAAGNTARIVMNGVNFLFSGLMDAGSFMSELSEAGASDEAAFVAGLGILASTGFLETWGDNTLLAPVDKFANFLFKQKDSQIINTATKSAMKIIKERGLSILGDIAASEITETVQEEVEYLAEVFAKELVVAYEAKYGNTLDREELGLTKDQIVESMKETARQTLLSTPLMTLGSNVIATGLDVAFGDISNQWRPNKYMNKEGATNIRGTREFVAFGEDIIDTSKKDADNGKANPIKAHTVGNYTFIDEKLSPKQYELIKSGNTAVYTVEADPKVTEKTATTLKGEAIDTGVYMKADTLDSYLANIEYNGNLDSYGYETKGKISAQNEGNATALYITLKDSGETIKINVGETNSSDADIAGLKNLTNVDYKVVERQEKAETESDNKKKKEKKKKDKKEKKTTQDKQSTTQDSTQTTQDAQSAPKAEEGARRQEGPSTSWRNNTQTTEEPVPDMFAGTSKAQPAQESESARKYSTDKAKTSKTFLQQYASQTFETAEILDANGVVTSDVSKGAYIALTDNNGNTEVVKSSKLAESTINKILAKAKSTKLDQNQVNKDHLATTNNGKTTAQKSVGIEPSTESVPQTIGQKEAQTTQTIVSRAEKVKTAKVIYDDKNIFPNSGMVDADGIGFGRGDMVNQLDGTYELVNDKGETVNNIEDASAIIGTYKDGREVVYKTEKLDEDDFFDFTEEARQIKTEEKPTSSKRVSKKEFTSNVETVMKTKNVSRSNAEDTVLLSTGVRNILDLFGKQIGLEDIVNIAMDKDVTNLIKQAKGLDEKVAALSELIVNQGENSYGLYEGLYGKDTDVTNQMKNDAEFAKETFSGLIDDYITSDNTHSNFTDEQLLFFDEAIEALKALYENNSAYLTDDELNELALLKDESDSKKSDIKLQKSVEPITVDEGTIVDPTTVGSSFRYNEVTGKYFISRDAAYGELVTALTNASKNLTADAIQSIYDQAQLASIFLSSLSEEAQDALVRRSIASNGDGSLLGGDENLLRLFFTFKESAESLPSNAKGASLPESAKVLLSSLSDKSTVVHEVGHILWSLDETFRERAKTEFKNYFESDPTGVGIRAVVEADPERFGGMTADNVIEALKQLTNDDFDYLRNANTEEAVMYMFEAWDEKRDTKEYTSGIKGLFERLAQFLKDVAEKIKNFFGVDILHETNNAIYAPLFANEEQYREFSEDAARNPSGIPSMNYENSPSSRRLVISKDGKTQVWQGEQSLVLMHALSDKNLLAQLDDGGNIAMPSLAVTTPDSVHFVEEGGGSVILVGNADMVGELMNDGSLFAGDIYSASTPEIIDYNNIEKALDYLKNDIDASSEAKKDAEAISRKYNAGGVPSDEDISNLFVDIKLKDKGNIHAPALDTVATATFSKLGKGSENYYASIFAQTTKDTWVDQYNSSASLKEQYNVRFNDNLYTYVVGELCPEIYTIYSDVTSDIARQYTYCLSSEERREIYSIYTRLAVGSEIYNQFKAVADSVIGDISSYDYNTWKVALSNASREKRFRDGSEINAANSLRLRSALPLKNGDISTTKNALRVLALKRLVNYDELHNKESKLNPKAKDFGTQGQASGFSRMYNDISNNIDSLIPQSDKRYIDSHQILEFVADWLTDKSDAEQGNLTGLEKAIDQYLSGMKFKGAKSMLVMETISSVNRIYRAVDTLETPYFEAKPRKILNVSQFQAAFISESASQEVEKRLKALGIQTFGFSDFNFNASDGKERRLLSRQLEDYANSVAGQKKRVMFQTMSDYIKNEQNSEINRKATSDTNRFEELVFYNIKERLLPVNDPVSAWRKNVEKRKTFAEPSDINGLVRIFENNGLYETINNQDVTQAQKDKFKKDIAQRFAYEFEDYTTFAVKVGEVMESLKNSKGNFRNEDSLEMKKALFFLYGYKTYTAKDGKKVTTASGLLSRMFMNDSAKSLYQTRASEGIAKKFTTVEKHLADKGVDVDLDSDIKRLFLSKKEWANKKTNGMQLELDSNLDYSSLDFKLDAKGEDGITTEDVYNFLSLMVEKTEDGYIPFAWRETSKDVDEGQSDNSFAIQGPLIDILNYDHKDYDGFTSNSFNTADSTYVTTAYNTFYDAGIPLMEGSLSHSPSLLDQYKRDCLTSYEVLKGKEAVSHILNEGISLTELETLRKVIGEAIAEKRTEVSEATEVEELFKTNTDKSDALFEIDSLLKEMEKQERGNITISKDSLERFQNVLTNYQNELNADSQIQFEERLKSIETKQAEREERLKSEADTAKEKTDSKITKLEEKNQNLRDKLRETKEDKLSSEQAIKDRFNAKIEDLAKSYKEKAQDQKDRYEAKLDKKNEQIKKKQDRIDSLVAQKQTSRQRANEIIEELFTTGKKLKDGSVSEDAQQAVKSYQDLLKNLRNEVDIRKKVEKKLSVEVAELKDRLTKELGIATATAKDFNDSGVLPIFEAGIDELKRVARDSGTAEVSQKLVKIVDTVSKQVNVGTEVALMDLFDYRTLYTSNNSYNYKNYRENMDRLRMFVVENMMDRGSAPNVAVITKSVRQLNTSQLSEFIDLVSEVSKDSRKYFEDMVSKDNEYYAKWTDSIVSEINTFAQMKGKDITQLTEEDSLGTAESKRGYMSKLGDLINDFTLNSVKYRYRFPTLYAFLYGGIDHEGKVYGGLNSSMNEVDTNFRKDVDSLNKIFIDKLSGTEFYEGQLTDKNIRLKWNQVKSSFRTTLGIDQFTDREKQAMNYKIESFIDPLGIKRYRLDIDENSTSAMKEVARFLGNIEIQQLKAEEKLSGLKKKITNKETAISNGEKTIVNALRHLDYWRTGQYYVSGEKYGKLIEEADRTKNIEMLEKRLKNAYAKLDRNKEILANYKEKVPVLEQRIVDYSNTGKRPNTNETAYTTQELLGIYMYARQEGGINRLIYSPRQVFKGDTVASSSNTNNLDIGNIIWVIHQFEDPNSKYAPLKEVADELSKLASKNFDAIRKTKFFLSNGEVLLDPIEHYFSFISDSSSIQDIQEQIDIGALDGKAEKKPDAKAQRAKANDKMTKERRLNSRGLELKVLDRAYSSLYQQEYYISMGEKIARLKDLIQNEEFQTSMKNYYGRNAGVANIVSLSKYVNSLSNSQKDLDPTALSGFVRYFTNNTAVGAMAFSLPTVLLQFPTMLWCLKDPHIGFKGLMTALYRSATDKSLYKYSPQMQERANSALQSIRATKNFGTFFGERFNNYTLEQAVTMTQNTGLWLLEKADAFVANAMWYATFEGVKQEYIEAGKDINLSPSEFMNLVANEATQRVLDISPIQGGKDNATAYSTNNAYVRQLLLFTNQTNKMLNGIVGGFRDFDVKGGKYLAKVLGVSLAIFMLNGIVNGKLWRKTKDDDDDEAEVNILKNIPYVVAEGLIDLIPQADTFFSTDQYGSTNIVSDLASVRKAIKKDPEERTDNQLSNAWFNLLSDTLSAGGLAGNATRKLYRSVRDRNPLQIYNSKYAELLED